MQTGNQKTIWYAFLSLSVVQINVLVPVFSSSCGDYNHNNKGTYWREGKIAKAPVYQIVVDEWNARHSKDRSSNMLY